MTSTRCQIGIVGGSGMLGTAIALALLDRLPQNAATVWISNRSGRIPERLVRPDLRIAPGNQTLAESCDVIVLCIPPGAAPEIGIDARDRLVVSVMAGVSIDRIAALTGARRVVRAMSSPAAVHGLAYSPWTASAAVTPDDRERVRMLFGACGAQDEVAAEDLIEVFTALTGPVPGFVAYFAAAMASYAVGKGVPATIADRAIRQLFLAAGRIMADGEPRPADHVRQMVDYGGTTAAGLKAMRGSAIEAEIAAALDAAIERTRGIG